MKFKQGLFILLFALPLLLRAEDANDLFAAAIGGKLERMEALLAQGIDVNSKTGTGRTALMGASFTGNARVVKTLLAYGADVNLADNAGTTALMDALVFGNEDIVNLLITAGADVNAAVINKAKKTGRDNLIKILEKAGAKVTGDVPAAGMLPPPLKEGEDLPAEEKSAESPAEQPEQKK
jgi:ankyrin repeat protein